MKTDLKKGEKLASRAFFLEAVLAGSKVVIGILSGSAVLVSDAVHSVSDISSIVTSWLGLRIAQRDPSKKFPYGYYKAENLGALIISLLILTAGGQMILSAWSRLFQFSSVHLPYLALAISLVDAIVLFFFGNYEIKVGHEIRAESLIAMGKENRTHIFSSLAVFLGTLAAIYKIPYIEGAIIFGISFLILKIGFEAAKNALFALMDVSPGEEIEKRVGRAIESVAGIEGFYGLRLRQAGPFVFGEAKVGIRRFVNVQRAHEIASEVERAVKQKVPQIDSFNVHVEPFRSDFRHLVIPVKSKDGLAAKMSSRFARSSYFLFVNLKGNNVKGFYILKNPYQNKKTKAGLAAAKLIAKQKSDILITSKVGEIALHVLRSNLIDVYQTQEKTAREAVKKFLNSRPKDDQS